jgi:hypothetical protein
MKHLIFKYLLCFFCIIGSCYTNAQTENNACSKYHTGFFSYTDSVGNTILVQRKKKYQYEKNTTTKVKTQFRINWVNDCTYEIEQTLTNSRAAKKFNHSTTRVVITTGDDEKGYQYTCECTGELKQKGYMKKISKKDFYDNYF